MPHYAPYIKTLVLLSCASTLSSCYFASRMSEFGSPPKVSNIQNPERDPNFKPVDMPMPEVHLATRQANSLWQAGSRSFFKDQRATKKGDILTVVVSMNDQGTLNNSTTLNRNSDYTIKTTNFFGLEKSPLFGGNRVLGTQPYSVNNDPQHTGTATVDRGETINLKIAAVITQVLPNGNMVISGRQEVRVNFELREVLITGVVRPQDILSNNTISYDKIAEARIVYGGRGQMTDVQQPPYGQQLMSMFSPF